MPAGSADEAGGGGSGGGGNNESGSTDDPGSPVGRGGRVRAGRWGFERGGAGDRGSSSLVRNPPASLSSNVIADECRRGIGGDPDGYLAARGWARSRRRRVEPRTPLLRTGSTRRWRWLVEGTLPDGSGVQLGGLVVAYDERGGEDCEGVFLTADGEDVWAVVVLDADYPDAGFITLTEHARELDWVGDDSTRRRVELESAAFRQAIRLTLAVGGDELEERRRFSPAVQLALASRGIPSGDRYEADRGAVVVAREGERSLADLPVLLDLLGDAVWLRAVVAGDAPGWVPDREALRTLALGGPTEAEREGFEPSIEENPQ